MGVADLVAAFNVASKPAFECRKALLYYEQKDSMQFQRITFSGTGADGSTFEIRTDLIRPGGDIMAAARDTALQLLDERKPPLEQKDKQP